MRKCKTEGWTFGAVRRDNVPPCMIGKAELNQKINGFELAPSSMIVFTVAKVPGTTRMMKFFCKKNAIGWKHLESNSFVVSGRADLLLALTDQNYIGDWHWDRSVIVHNGSGAGDSPKRSRIPRFLPTTKEGAKVLKEMDKADKAHVGAGNPPEQHLQGDESLDNLDMERRREAKLWYKQHGLPCPPSNIGSDGKVM